VSANRSSSKPSSKPPRPGLLVVSPHLDDAVFGCGALLAGHPGAGVVTVFAGRPPHYETLTAWDAAAGFRAGEDVVAARREEDRAALALLRARPVWLEFCDSQYARTPSAREVAAKLDEVIRGEAASTVAVPLGLFHSDHQLAHEAALLARSKHLERMWLAYEDAIYRRIPGLVDDRLGQLNEAGVRTIPYTPDGGADDSVKREAIACYASQIRALARPGYPGFEDALAPERYWRLEG
jgi:LmbE family N-acetylglucosaminyl deacetylase